MNVLWEELTAGLASYDDLVRVLIRLFAAVLLGGAVALQRVRATKPSGLRTHILVCLGTTLVLMSASFARISLDGASRIIEGIVIGIGFVGAGSILKSSEEHLVHGLTASVRLWSTAAVGIAIGLGQLGMAVIAAMLIIVVLWVISAIEERMGKRPPLGRLKADQP
jgi:putative Mg2+ transporter-C (MgtC) family protein